MWDKTHIFIITHEIDFINLWYGDMIIDWFTPGTPALQIHTEFIQMIDRDSRISKGSRYALIGCGDSGVGTKGRFYMHECFNE